MPRKKIEMCMFCMELPCVCDGPPQPKKVSKSKPANKTPASSAPASSSAPDLRSAMKAAVTGEVQVAPRVGFEMKTKTEAPSNKIIEEAVVDSELGDCLNLVYSMLHPDELRKYKSFFDKPTSRAARWRLRR